MSPNRSLLLIVGGIAALVALAAAVVLLRDDRPPQFPADSPQAALQAYLATWEDGDLEAAWGWFSADVQATTPLVDFRRIAQDFREYGMPPNGPQRRVFIDQVTGSGDSVVLHLTVEERWGEGLNASTNRSSRTIPMLRESITGSGNPWRIDQLLTYLDVGFASPY